MIHSIKPYVSTEDIAKGERWTVNLSRELEEAKYGIICLTPDNIGSPWLNFEAGVLSKSFDEGFVSPFLYRIKKAAVEGPLAQFQSTVFDRSDVFRLLETMNSVSDTPLDRSRLEGGFNVWWPEFRKAVEEIGAEHRARAEVQGPTRSVEDMVAEVLDLVRTQQKVIVKPPATPVPAYAESLGKAVAPVDITEATVLLAKLRATADFMTDSRAQTVSLIRVRALITMLADLLPPVLDGNLYRGILNTTEESLRGAEGNLRSEN